MKKTSTLILIILFSIAAQAQDWEWAINEMKESGGYNGYVCYDHHGSLFTSGQFGGTVTIGTYTFTALKQPAHYVAKFDITGKPIWGRAYDLKTYCNAITSDKDGNLYAIGTFSSTQNSITMDGVLLKYDTTHSRTFLAKYSSTGTLLWARNDIYAIAMQFRGITIDTHGNIIVIGDFWGSDLKVGGITYPWNTSVNGYSDGFLVKLDSTGNAIWARTMGGPAEDYLFSVGTNPNDEVYITGSFNSNTINVGGSNVVKKDTTQPSYDFLLAKFDANGNFSWSRTAGGQEDVVGFQTSELIVDEAGRVTVTGPFSADSLAFDTKIIAGNHVCQCAFVVQYDLNGVIQWANSAFGTNNTVGRSLTRDFNNNIYVTGEFNATAKFGSQNLTSSGDGDIFIFKCDASGVIKWAISAGSPLYERPQKICSDEIGGIYISGYNNSPNMTFGNHSIDSAGIFLAKLSLITGIDEHLSTTMNIYPNPTQGAFTVYCLSRSLGINGVLDVYNVLGEIVYTEPFNGKEKTVNCKLREGIYFVRVKDEIKQYVQKIIVE